MERISLISPNILDTVSHIIFVAPHGRDDINTTLIAEHAAIESNGYAVINNGWKKQRYYDYESEFANCNNIQHLKNDVVKEEFFEPLIEFACEIRKTCLINPIICTIHGMSNNTILRSGVKDMDILIGHGRGGRLTIPDIGLKSICFFLDKLFYKTYIAGTNTRFSGKSKNNLIQLFSDPAWYQNIPIKYPVYPVTSCGIPAYSLQMEISYDLRDSDTLAIEVGKSIGYALKQSIFEKNVNVFKNYNLKSINRMF